MPDLFTDMAVGALAALVMVLTLAMMPYAGLSIRRLSLPSFFVLVYLLSVYLGSVVLYFKWDAYAISLGVTGEAVLLRLLLLTSAALLLVVAGFIFAHRLLGLRAQAAGGVQFVASTARQRWWFIGITCLCVSVLVLYLRRIEDVALFAALDGDLPRAAVARSRMGTEFPGKYWRYQLFFRSLLDLSVLYFFVDYVRSRSWISGIMLAASLVTASFTALMAIEKGPMAQLVVMLFLAYIAVGDGRYWNRATKYVVVLFAAVVTASFMIFMGAESPGAAFTEMVGRITTGQIIPAYFYLDQFPRFVDYLWGSSFPNPGGFLPFEPFPLTLEISKVIFPQNLERAVVGSAPTVYWAEMYANFGPIGVLLSSFVVGVLVYLAGDLIRRLPVGAASVALYAFLAMHFRTLTGTGLSSYLVDTTLYAVVLVTGTAILLGQRPGHASVPE